MKFSACEREQQVLAALETGGLAPGLQDHIEGCAVCRDVASVWSFLHMAARTGEETELPSSGLVWWRAQLAAKRAMATRSVAPIKAVQQVALAVAALLGIAFAVLFGPQLFEKTPPLMTAALTTALGAILLTAGLLSVWSKKANEKWRR